MNTAEDPCENCENCRRLAGEIAVLHAEGAVARAEVRQTLEQLMAQGTDITPVLEKLQQDGGDVQSILCG